MQILKEFNSLIYKIKNQLGSRYLQKWASRYSKSNGLVSFIDKLNEKWDSAGVSFVDYCLLYHYIEKREPQYFLELGTGKSTHVIAKAMHDFCYKKYNGNIKLCSTETEETWYKKAVANIPNEYKEFVEIHNLKFIPFSYLFIHGLCSENLPNYPFDCCFVDRAATPGHGINMDLMKIILNSNKPIDAIFDSQKKQVLAYFSIIDKKNFKFLPNGFTYLSNISKKELPIELPDYRIDKKIKELFKNRINYKWSPTYN